MSYVILYCLFSWLVVVLDQLDKEMPEEPLWKRVLAFVALTLGAPFIQLINLIWKWVHADEMF